MQVLKCWDITMTYLLKMYFFLGYDFQNPNNVFVYNINSFTVITLKNYTHVSCIFLNNWLIFCKDWYSLIEIWPQTLINTLFFYLFPEINLKKIDILLYIILYSGLSYTFISHQNLNKIEEVLLAKSILYTLP